LVIAIRLGYQKALHSHLTKLAQTTPAQSLVNDSQVAGYEFVEGSGAILEKAGASRLFCGLTLRFVSREPLPESGGNSRFNPDNPLGDFCLNG
jgi:hypothetical protein